MSIQTFTPAVPSFTAVMFRGISSLEDILELSGHNEFRIDASGNNISISIANLVIHKNQWLVRSPDGSLRMMNDAQVRKEFDHVKKEF